MVTPQCTPPLPAVQAQLRDIFKIQHPDTKIYYALHPY